MIIGILVTVSFLVIFYIAVAFMNRDDDQPEEVVGDMVDIRQFFKKWEDE